MKEALHPISGSNCIFRETFQSHRLIMRNGGIATDVSLQDGVGIFIGSSSIVYGAKARQWHGANFPVSVRIIYTPGVVNTTQMLFALGDTNLNGFGVFFINNILYARSWGGTGESSATYTGITTTKQSIIATFVDGVSGAIKLYINGVAVGVDGNNGSEGIITPDYDLTIGKNPKAATQYITGDMEVVEVYNKVFSASEVANLYNNKHHAGLITDGLVGYWDFMRGSSYDWSGNGNDGTDTDIVYTHGLGAQFNDGTAKIEVGNLSVILKTIIVVAKLETTTEELIDLDSTNKIDVTAGTLACGGLATEYVNGIIATAVGNALNTFMAVTDATGISAIDFDIGEANFDGRMSAIVVYTIQLSAAEIAQIYQYFKTRFNL